MQSRKHASSATIKIAFPAFPQIRRKFLAVDINKPLLQAKVEVLAYMREYGLSLSGSDAEKYGFYSLDTDSWLDLRKSYHDMKLSIKSSLHFREMKTVDPPGSKNAHYLGAITHIGGSAVESKIVGSRRGRSGTIVKKDAGADVNSGEDRDKQDQKIWLPSAVADHAPISTAPLSPSSSSPSSSSSAPSSSPAQQAEGASKLSKWRMLRASVSTIHQQAQKNKTNIQQSKTSPKAAAVVTAAREKRQDTETLPGKGKDKIPSKVALQISAKQARETETALSMSMPVEEKEKEKEKEKEEEQKSASASSSTASSSPGQYLQYLQLLPSDNEGNDPQKKSNTSQNRKNTKKNTKNTDADVDVDVEEREEEAAAIVTGEMKDRCSECFTAAAIVHCLHCGDIFCQNCSARIHAKGGRMFHVLLSVEEWRSLPKELLGLCRVHPSQPVTHLCLVDGQRVCSHCLVLQEGRHMRHRVVPLREADSTCRQALTEAEALLSNQATTLQHARQSAHLSLAALLSAKQKCRQRLHQSLLQIRQRLQEEEQQALRAMEVDQHEKDSFSRKEQGERERESERESENQLVSYQRQWKEHSAFVREYEEAMVMLQTSENPWELATTLQWARQIKTKEGEKEGEKEKEKEKDTTTMTQSVQDDSKEVDRWKEQWQLKMRPFFAAIPSLQTALHCLEWESEGRESGGVKHTVHIQDAEDVRSLEAEALGQHIVAVEVAHAQAFPGSFALNAAPGHRSSAAALSSSLSPNSPQTVAHRQQRQRDWWQEHVQVMNTNTAVMTNSRKIDSDPEASHRHNGDPSLVKMILIPSFPPVQMNPRVLLVYSTCLQLYTLSSPSADSSTTPLLPPATIELADLSGAPGSQSSSMLVAALFEAGKGLLLLQTQAGHLILFSLKEMTLIARSTDHLAFELELDLRQVCCQWVMAGPCYNEWIILSNRQLMGLSWDMDSGWQLLPLSHSSSLHFPQAPSVFEVVESYLIIGSRELVVIDMDGGTPFGVHALLQGHCGLIQCHAILPLQLLQEEGKERDNTVAKEQKKKMKMRMKLLVTASNDFTLRVWNVSCGTCLHVLTLNGGIRHVVSLANDYLLLLTTSGQQRLYQWNSEAATVSLQGLGEGCEVLETCEGCGEIWGGLSRQQMPLHPYLARLTNLAL
jgi:hypothetical protein